MTKNRQLKRVYFGIFSKNSFHFSWKQNKMFFRIHSYLAIIAYLLLPSHNWLNFSLLEFSLNFVDTCLSEKFNHCRSDSRTDSLKINSQILFFKEFIQFVINHTFNQNFYKNYHSSIHHYKRVSTFSLFSCYYSFLIFCYFYYLFEKCTQSKHSTMFDSHAQTTQDSCVFFFKIE